MADFHVKTRNSIRKGQKLGLIVEKKDDPESWQWMQGVHENSIRSLDGVPKTMAVFNALREAFKEAVELWVGSLDGKPVSGVVTVRYRKTIEYVTPVVEED